MSGTPVISIVGKSDAGKTTLLEKLIAELKKRGYRVGTIKHDTHGFEIDQPGKDSWRHAQAGSDVVMIASPSKLALIKRLENELTLDEVASYITDVDIILTEGYKRADKPKIEVHRKSVGGELLCSPQELLAVVTDEPLNVPVPQFSFDEAEALVDLIERQILRKREFPLVSIIVDGRGVPVFKDFTRQIVAKTVKGMLSALQGGVGRFISLKIDLGEGGEK